MLRIVSNEISNNFYDSLYTGGDVTMEYNGVNIILIISHSSHNILEFVERIIKKIGILNQETAITPHIMEQAKNYIENFYKWSPDYPSFDQAKDLMQSIFASFNVSFFDTDLIEKCLDRINKITPKRIVKLSEKFIQNSKLTMLFLGNITPQRAMNLTESFSTFFLQNSQSSDLVNHRKKKEKKDDFDTFKLYQKFTFDFPDEMKHYMVRNKDLDERSNESSYMTLFYDGYLNIENKLMILMIVEAITNEIKEDIYNAKVKKATVEVEFIKYGIVQGLQIMIYGNRVKPIEMETILDKTLRKFVFETVLNYNSSDVKLLLEKVLTKYVEYKNEVSDVMEKQYNLLWVHTYTQEKRTHYGTADFINLKSFIDFVHDFMIKRQKRMTIEIMPTLTEQDMNFKNESANLLGDIDYEITDEDKLFDILQEGNLVD
jgi:hypothetical protein